MARKTPEIPGSSLADIAFMLLIFFLVTTTMDVDSGLERLLPQWVEDVPEDTPEVRERNIFVVLVNRNNDLLVENEYARIEDLRERTKEFIENPTNDVNLPEKEPKEVPYFGTVEVTKGVISLRNDLDTKYGTYVAVQNELVAAINELREELSKSKFGKSFKDLEKDQKKAIKTIIPSKISEAETKQAK
ncbi:MAG: biopolymer transporter ExbD [Bacteroidetes bacterium]|nr:biopolymer transporter ExbD [Bacteroidota bacterium]